MNMTAEFACERTFYYLTNVSFKYLEMTGSLTLDQISVGPCHNLFLLSLDSNAPAMPHVKIAQIGRCTFTTYTTRVLGEKMTTVSIRK